VRTIVDLSVPLQAGIASDPPGHLPEIDYYDHRQTAAEVVSFFPGATIDEVPLDWCLQPAVKLDFRHFQDGYVVTADDVESELARIGHTLAPLEIVLVNTSAGEFYVDRSRFAPKCQEPLIHCGAASA
jgi:kynurenine formamidase